MMSFWHLPNSNLSSSLCQLKQKASMLSNGTIHVVRFPERRGSVPRIIWCLQNFPSVCMDDLLYDVSVKAHGIQMAWEESKGSTITNQCMDKADQVICIIFSCLLGLGVRAKFPAVRMSNATLPAPINSEFSTGTPGD